MQERYAGNGIGFEYPENWKLQEQPAEEGVAISVNSSGTSFWTVSLDSEGPEPQRVMQSAIATFREEYSEMDVYPVESRICHRDAIGRDVEFVCLDVLNTACLRSFRTGRFTVFILYQGYDSELAETQDVLESITASLACDGDEDLFDEE